MPSGHSVAVTQTVSYAFPPFPWRGEDMHLSDSDGSSRASEPLLSSIQSSVPQIALTLPGKFFHLSNCDSSEVSGWQESQLGSCILLSHRISPGSDDNSGGTREEENGEWDSEKVSHLYPTANKTLRLSFPSLLSWEEDCADTLCGVWQAWVQILFLGRSETKR